MIVEWTWIAASVAALAGLRGGLRTWRSFRAGAVGGNDVLRSVGGSVGTVVVIVAAGAVAPWLAPLLAAPLLPELLLSERHYLRYEDWLMSRLLPGRWRREYHERLARERDAEQEFLRRMHEPPARLPGSQGNDP